MRSTASAWRFMILLRFSLSVGVALRGTELRVDEHEELLARGPGVMLGYWDDEEATRAAIDTDGWFHTGDKAKIEGNHVYITGRLKEIIVMANGEKVPPANMEMAIAMHPLFEQVIVIGDNKPYLTAIIVLEPEQWKGWATGHGLQPDDPASLHDERVINAISDELGT